MALKASLVLTAAVALAGCHSAGDDYDDFLARRGVAAGDDGEVQSTLEDLSGRFLLHALLAGGLDLGLTAELTMDVSAQPIPLHARLWLATANPDTDAPLVETDSVVAADGTFDLAAEPLTIAAGATPGINTPVSANVVLHAATQSPDAWCGSATGDVVQPLSLDLSGSTFAARRDDDGTLALTDVPQSCFPHGGADGGVIETPEPMPPDLSSVSSTLADLSGDWILQANLAQSIPLSLWASLRFTPSPNGAGGSLDGALRRATDAPGSVALTTFSTAVAPDGRFALWLPALVVGTTQASVLLVGATRSVNVFCGAGAGRVHKPIDLDLAGTTFGATRWTPGSALPTKAPDHCL